MAIVHPVWRQVPGQHGAHSVPIKQKTRHKHDTFTLPADWSLKASRLFVHAQDVTTQKRVDHLEQYMKDVEMHHHSSHSSDTSVEVKEVAPMFDLQQLNHCFQEIRTIETAQNNVANPAHLLQRTRHWRTHFWNMHDSPQSLGVRLIAWRTAGDKLHKEEDVPCLPHLTYHDKCLHAVIVQMPMAHGSTKSQIVSLPHAIINTEQPKHMISLRQLWMSADISIHSEHVLAFLAQLMAWFVKCHNQVGMVLHTLSIDELFVSRTAADTLWFSIPVRTIGSKIKGHTLYSLPTFGIVPQFQALREVAFVWNGTAYTSPAAHASSPTLAWRYALSQLAVSIQAFLRTSDAGVLQREDHHSQTLKKILHCWISLTDWSSHGFENTPHTPHEFLLDQMQHFRSTFEFNVDSLSGRMLSELNVVSL